MFFSIVLIGIQGNPSSYLNTWENLNFLKKFHSLRRTDSSLSSKNFQGCYNTYNDC